MASDDQDDSPKHIITSEVLRAIRDDPKAREAAGNVGRSLSIVTKTIENALLPLAAVNYAFEKAREYFSGQFQEDLSKRAAEIPAEHIVAPKASVAGPTLQGLAFTHEEPDLKAMYLSLLTTAMDDRTASDAHPAFVEIIKQMTSEEARLIRSFLGTHGTHPIVQIHSVNREDRSYRILIKHIVNFIEENERRPAENARFSAMIENWIRLGLVNVDYTKHPADKSAFDWVEKRPEFIKLKEACESEERMVTYEKGAISRTDFGAQFAAAVGIV